MISKYLSPFLPTKRYIWLLLPYSGSLRSHFPTLTVFQLLDHRYYDQLRPPFRHLGLLRFRSRPNTLLDFSSFCVLVRLKKKKNMPDKLTVQVEICLNCAQPFSSPIGCRFRYFCSQGTNGSLKFPDYPYVHMPRS